MKVSGGQKVVTILDCRMQLADLAGLARMIHEFVSRDREDDLDTGQPQGLGSEAYLNSTSQGPIPEDARKDAHIRGRSRKFVKYPGSLDSSV